ncbi:MAG: peptide ABC transporter substrate-binding protein [Bacillota bacterium]
MERFDPQARPGPPGGGRGRQGMLAPAGAGGRAAVSLYVVLLALLLVLPGVGAGGCRRQPGASVPTTQVRQGGTVRVALPGEVASLDPREARTPAERIMAGLLFSALAGVEGRGEVFPDLAVGWAGGRGGTYWTVRIRPDAVWHDGQQVTSDDVLFTLRSHRDPLPGLTWQRVDSRTVRFFLSHPDAGFPYWLATVPILPAHLLTDGAGAARQPVGTGPFRLEPGQGGTASPGGEPREIALLPHLRYHRGRPHLDGLVVRIYPSLAEASRAVLRGEVDFGPVLPGDAERARAAGWRVIETHQSFYIALAFNCQRVPADLRRAIVHAIDRPTLASTLGVREVPHPLPLISWAYPPEVAWGTYDPGAAGRLVQKLGEPPSLDLMVPRDDSLRARAARLVSAYMGTVGVRATVREEDPDAFVARLLPPFEYDLALIPEPFPANPDLTPLLHSGQIPAGGRGGNVFTYRQPALDALLDRLRQELDPATRKSLVQQVTDLVCREVPLLPLWTERVFLAVRPGLAGPVASPYGWCWNVHDWWWQSP